MLKDYKNIIIFIAIVFLVIAGILFYFLEIKKIQEVKFPEAPPKTEEYSYENIIYNFWGFVQEKQGDTVSVEGIIPEPGKIQTKEESLLTIKFKITADTKIVKLETVKFEKAEEKTKQIFVGPEAIQINDHLALKADKIDTEKKEAFATDILILESLPAMPTPQGTTSPAASSQ